MVIFDPVKKISLNSPYFDNMRDKLDAAIRSTFAVMDQKEMGKATVTLKINIEMEKETIKDDNTMSGQREVTVPKIDYKTSCEVKAKDEMSGQIVSGYNELVRGDDGSYYIVDPDEVSGQINMFNSYDEIELEEDDDEE